MTNKKMFFFCQLFNCPFFSFISLGGIWRIFWRIFRHTATKFSSFRSKSHTTEKVMGFFFSFFFSTMTIFETHGNLLRTDIPVIAHCISRNARQSAGIARKLKDKFPVLKTIRPYEGKIGGVVVREENGTIIVGMVTKEKHFHKPTYENLEKALLELKKYALQNGITALALPCIGAGRDFLHWPTVRQIIFRHFWHCSTCVTIYYWQ